MKRLLTYIMVGVFLALPSFAADGDACTTAQWGGVTTKGSMVPLWCVLICDEDIADADCADFDTATLTGIPDVLVFELYENGTNCTAGRFEIDTTGDEGLNVDDQNTHDIATTNAMAIGGVTRIVLDTRVAPPDRYILGELTLEAACESGHSLDLMMIGYGEKDS